MGENFTNVSKRNGHEGIRSCNSFCCILLSYQKKTKANVTPGYSLDQGSRISLLFTVGEKERKCQVKFPRLFSTKLLIVSYMLAICLLLCNVWTCFQV